MNHFEHSRRQFIQTCGGGAAALYLGGCATSGPVVSDQPRTAEDFAIEGVNRARWPELADVAIGRMRRVRADYGDIRLIESRVQRVVARDRRIDDLSDSIDAGYGIRVLLHGAWGFAAGSVFSADGIRETTDHAIKVAKASATLMQKGVRLANEPVHRASVVTPFTIDPFTVPLDEKCALLIDTSERLHERKGIAQSRGFLWAQRDLKYFASTEGSAIDFNLLATGGGFGATAVGDDGFESRHFQLPYLRMGYEQVEAADFAGQAPFVADQAVEKLLAKTPAPGQYDLVLDPEHLALTIHETCGHPSELDRALGYEANFAGTSFLTPDKLGRLRYGSEHVSLVADNTQARGLASTGFDDDGVACQRWPIVDQGKFAGYSTSREVATRIGEPRSRGSCRADSWASVPIVRIANVGLEPGGKTLEGLIADVRNGILIGGMGSFSIDQRRYNFQFGGDCFWEIKNGRRGAMLKNVIYQGITPQFWAACDGVADRDHRRQYGFITCGKGQPMQSGWMTHAASHARFRDASVIHAGVGGAI